MENKDKPAFPSDNHTEYGLTKREYFAVMALQGLRASGIKRESHTAGRTYYYVESSHTVAKMALEDADALLKELEK